MVIQCVKNSATKTFKVYTSFSNRQMRPYLCVIIMGACPVEHEVRNKKPSAMRVEDG